jgi:hypothetical protein
MRSLALSLCVVLASCATTSGRTGAGEPADGRALMARMHDRYAGRWFQTLTFVQRTTQWRPDGKVQVSTWYESQRGPRLRIDVGDPSAGNGALYTADSLYVMRAGKVARTVAERNPFLPLIVGVYIQPLDVTVAQIAPYKGGPDPYARAGLGGQADVNVPLPETFFQAEHWGEGEHWAGKR